MRKYCLFLLLVAVTIRLAPAPIEDEYYRKAALLSVFSEYIQWPEQSGMADKNSPFIIGVIGTNPFGEILQASFAQEENRIKNKQVKILFISKKEEINGCHILFISKSNEPQLAELMTFLKEKPIVTIAETKGFGKKGVMFNFFKSRGEIRFEINGASLRDSRLIVDSQLLSIGKVINLPEAKK
jgi:hypothetical protein